MAEAKLLLMSGSLRADSFNTKLVREAARLFGPAEVTMADLRLPLFDEDLEAQGRPAEVQRLIDQVKAADAIAISTPEYNKFPSGTLKNALDWLSRESPMPPAGKPTAIMAATAGRAGGERAVATLRLMLVPFQADVLLGPDVHVGQAKGQFDGDKLINEINLTMLTQLMGKLRKAAGAAAVQAI